MFFGAPTVPLVRLVVDGLLLREAALARQFLALTPTGRSAS